MLIILFFLLQKSVVWQSGEVTSDMKADICFHAEKNAAINAS